MAYKFQTQSSEIFCIFVIVLVYKWELFLATGFETGTPEPHFTLELQLILYLFTEPPYWNENIDCP